MQKSVCEFIHAIFLAKFQKFVQLKPLVFSTYSTEIANKKEHRHIVGVPLL